MYTAQVGGVLTAFLSGLSSGSSAYSAQKNTKKLKVLYGKSLQVKSAIPHPLIMGIIRGTR